MVTSDLGQALRQLLSALRGADIVRVVVALFFILQAGLLTAAPAALIGLAVDAIRTNGIWTKPVLDLVILLGAAVGALELTHFCRKYLVEGVAVRVQAEAQLRFSEALLRAPVDSVHSRPIGETMTLVDQGVNGIVKLMKLALLEFGPALVTALVAVAFVVAVHPAVGAVMVLVLAINVATTLSQIRSQRGIRVDLLTRRARFNAQLGELIINLDSVRASGVAALEQHEFGKTAEAIRETEFRHHQAMMMFDGFKGIADGGGLITVLLVCLLLYAAGNLTLGGIIQVTLLYQSAVVPLKMLHRVMDESHEASVQVLRGKTLTDIGADPGLLGTEGFARASEHAYAFEASNLTYTLSDGRYVLDALTYTVPVGTLDIILGPTGTGKSTLLKVILGLNASYAGSAKVFGTEVKLADKDLLSQQLCYVAQKPFIKAGTLRSNLLLGQRAPISDDKLIEAALLAGLPLGENGWQEGLDRAIGERGTGLSGGEQQRIAFGRLFLSDAKLFILDEATSQLDEPMEDLVLGNLAKRSAGRAIVMVAHRSTTRKWANRLFRLDQGKLVPIAPHDPPQDAPPIVKAA